MKTIDRRHRRPGPSLAAGFCCALSMLTLAAPLALTGCGPAEEPRAPLPEAQQVYSGVRGQVTSLATEGPGAQPLMIHHEHIPDFVGATGEVHQNADGTPGMKAMTMPFPELAPGVSLEGIDAGDKVAFELSVAWEGTRPTYWISAIEELPADAELYFGGPMAMPETPDTTNDDDNDARP